MALISYHNVKTTTEKQNSTVGTKRTEPNVTAHKFQSSDSDKVEPNSAQLR